MLVLIVLSGCFLHHQQPVKLFHVINLKFMHIIHVATSIEKERSYKVNLVLMNRKRKKRTGSSFMLQ